MGGGGKARRGVEGVGWRGGERGWGGGRGEGGGVGMGWGKKGGRGSEGIGATESDRAGAVKINKLVGRGKEELTHE